MRTLILMVLVSSAFAQDHAPTPDQCKADYRLWSPKGTTLKDMSFSDVSWGELMRRGKIMSDCAKTDPEGMRAFAKDAARLGNNAPLNYSEFSSHLHTVASDRAVSFLMKHHLMDQFVKEDEAATRQPAN